MPEQSPRSRIGGSWTGQLLSSRRGALTVAALAALLAGVLLYLFVQHYRKNSNAAAPPANVYVFVAQKFIAQGTPAQTVSAESLLRRTQVPAKQAVAGAITDPSEITGEVAAASITAGQQVSLADFTHANISVAAYLSGTERAIALPLDAPHGLTAYLAAGDTVDVMADVDGTTTMLAQNISILANTGGDVVLRVTDRQALQLAGASDATKIWLTLRPPTGAQQSVAVGQKAAA